MVCTGSLSLLFVNRWSLKQNSRNSKASVFPFLLFCFNQRLVSIPELLSGIKLLCMRFQPDLVTAVDDLRLDILLRMLKSPHFSAKMNSLKEVGLLFVCVHVHVCRWNGWLVTHWNHNLKKMVQCFLTNYIAIAKAWFVINTKTS